MRSFKQCPIDAFWHFSCTYERSARKTLTRLPYAKQNQRDSGFQCCSIPPQYRGSICKKRKYKGRCICRNYPSNYKRTLACSRGPAVSKSAGRAGGRETPARQIVHFCQRGYEGLESKIRCGGREWRALESEAWDR